MVKPPPVLELRRPARGGGQLAYACFYKGGGGKGTMQCKVCIDGAETIWAEFNHPADQEVSGRAHQPSARARARARAHPHAAPARRCSCTAADVAGFLLCADGAVREEARREALQRAAAAVRAAPLTPAMLPPMLSQPPNASSPTGTGISASGDEWGAVFFFGCVFLWW